MHGHPLPTRLYFITPSMKCNNPQSAESRCGCLASHTIGAQRNWTWAGTDLNLGASFDRESSATGSSRTVPAELRAYPHLARHAVKCAEEPRIRIVSWQS